MEKNLYDHDEEQYSNHSHTIGVIGLGNMGLAAVRGLIQSELGQQYHLLVCNRTKEATQAKLASQVIDSSQLRITEKNNEIAQDCDLIFLALKQLQMKEELEKWREQKLLKKDTLIVSFAAGVKAETIKRWLGNDKQPVARVMPNTPTASGRGVLGWFISEDATVKQENMLQEILQKLGFEIQVKTDADIDVITAISGSGPAYAYRFGEAMIKYAEKNGFDAQTARVLVSETLIGAAVHLLKTGEALPELRRKITSKGGTTEAAIASFEADDLDSIVEHAMESAQIRAGEIAKQFDKME